MTPTGTGQPFAGSFDEAPMHRAQVLAVALVAAIATMDGFDLQAMAFVAPVVGKTWTIGRATLGLILASSLFGMAGGAVVLSPLADVFGRRPAVLCGLALITAATILSGLSHQVWQLVASRAITGVGIGLMVALASTLAAEFSNRRWRSLAVSTTIVGSAMGNFLVGVLASVVLRGHPWSWVFFAGAIVGTVLFILALFGLPESPAYLMNRGSPRALLALNKVLTRFGQAPVSALPVREQPRSALQLVLSPPAAWTIVRMAAVFILSAMGAYYVLSWLPQLITGAGFPPSTASLVTAASTLVAIVSGLAAGALGARIRPIILASVAMVFTGLSVALIGVAPPTIAMLLLAACVFAFFQSAGVASFYATLTVSFPPLSRVSGMGLVMGIGRLTSGIGPYAAGALFAAGWTRMSVSMVFAAATMAAGLILAASIRRIPENVATDRQASTTAAWTLIDKEESA